jgi:trk system potassium uptake protein TrkA
MRIIVIGCGRVGAGLAHTLIQRGHKVSVVDSNPEAFERLGPTFHGKTVEGSGFDRGVLIQASIERADALATVTSSDETNVVTAQLARLVFRVPRVVARLYDPRKAEIYRHLGLQTISQLTWGINRIADLLCYSPLDTVVTLGEGRIDIVEADVPHLLVGRSLQELSLFGEVSVVAIHRGGKTFLPMPGTLFEAGDRIYLAVLATSSDRLKALLGLA